MQAGPPKDVRSVAASRPPPVGRVLGLSMLAVFATTLFVRAVDPIIPRIADHFTMDPRTVALLASAFSLPYAITQPVLGGDRRLRTGFFRAPVLARDVRHRGRRRVSELGRDCGRPRQRREAPGRGQ